MLRRVINWLLPSGWWAKCRRCGQLIAALCLVLIAVVALIVGTSGGRESVLRFALLRAGAVVPGELSALPKCPRPGHIELHNVVWATETDTLATAERLVLDASLPELIRRRDLHLHELVVAELRADLDAIATALAANAPADDTVTVSAESEPATLAVPYLNSSSIDGLPSAALDRLTITDLEIVLPGGRPLRVVDLNGRIELRQNHAAEVALALRALPLPDLGVCWRWHARVADGLQVAVAPIVLTTGLPPELPTALGLPLTGEIEVPSATLSALLAGRSPLLGLRITDLEITGALGDYTLSADTRETRKVGFAVAGEWAQPPAYLVRLTDTADPDRPAPDSGTETAAWSERLALLRQYWPADLQLGFDLAGELTTANDSSFAQLVHARLHGDFRLPGPAELVPLLPKQAQVADLSSLGATLDAEMTFAAADTTYQLQLDLGATPWLEPGLVAVRGDMNSLQVETLAIGLPGARLNGSGTVSRDHLDVDIDLAVPEAAALARRAGIDAPVAGRLQLTTSVRGPLPLSLETTDLVVETLAVDLEGATLTSSGTVSRDRLAIDVDLAVPDAAALARRTRLDMPVDGQLQLTATARGSLPRPDGKLDLTAAGRYGDIELPAVTAHLDHDDGRIVASVEAPAGIQTPQIQLDALSFGFDGTLADSLTAADGDLNLAVAGHELSALLRAEIHAQTAGATTVRVDSLAVAHRQRTLTNRSPFALRIDPAIPSFELTDFTLWGALGRLDGGGTFAPDKLDFACALDLGLDLAGWEDHLPPQLPVRADSISVVGNCRLGGNPSEPVGTLDLSARLVGPAEVGTFGLRAGGWLLNGSGDWPAPLNDAEPQAPAPTFAPRNGIAAELHLMHGDSVLAASQIALPGTIVLQPTAVTVDPRRDLAASLTIPDIDLETLEPILPPGTNLKGTLRCDATATGAGERIELAGEIGAENLYATLEDGSWLTASGIATVGGTISEPVIAGGIEVSGGLIRLPEAPASLLAVEGESLLWQAEARADSLAATVVTDSLPAMAPPVKVGLLPSVEVALSCPGDLWLRGRNLDVEMAGDLNLTLYDGVTGLGGSLRALRGDLRILGRTLKITKGDILFFPDERRINPQLDLRLEAQIDKYLYKIAILGRAEKPEMELTSEPPMSEGDVVSGLLFGKPLSDLDSGQADLVADRSKEIAAAYGAAMLTQGVAQEIGVDLITIKAASSSDETSSLVVGKYLSPKVMVQYETPLEERATSIVRLEYSINSQLKVDTSISQGEDSGIDLKWLLDY